MIINALLEELSYSERIFARPVRAVHTKCKMVRAKRQEQRKCWS